MVAGEDVGMNRRSHVMQYLLLCDGCESYRRFAVLKSNGAVDVLLDVG